MKRSAGGKQALCQPLRVAHVLCDLSPGGAERLVLELCRRHAPDIAPEVWAVQPGGALAGAFEEAGFGVRCAGRLPGRLGLRALARLRFGLGEGRAGAAVVHTHLFAGDVWGRLAAAPRRGLISTLHNPDPEERWRALARRALDPLCPCTVAVSEAVAGWARAGGLRADRVIYNGIDLARFAGCAAARAAAGYGRRLLAVGRRVPQKGLDVLLEALPPGWTLDVLGEGPFCPDHPQVRWRGRQEDVAGWMARADALIIPSRWEGFSLAAAEGLAAGLPIVASAVDALPEVLGDAALLVPPGRSDRLREAILRLDEPDLRAALSARALARAPRFGIDRMVAEYEALYREVASSNVPTASRAAT